MHSIVITTELLVSLCHIFAREVNFTPNNPDIFDKTEQITIIANGLQNIHAKYIYLDISPSNNLSSMLWGGQEYVLLKEPESSLITLKLLHDSKYA